MGERSFSDRGIAPALAMSCGLAVMLCAAACSDAGDSDAFDSAADGSGTSTPATTAGPGTMTAAPSATSTGTSAGSSSGGESDGDSTEDEEIKLDVGAPPGGLGPCGCELAYLWVANAEEGTVSKINVRTQEEEGRYITRPDGDGNPSRTSVNLAGDVAVANRHGGLTKIYAEEGDCEESNGMPGIQTSSGAADVLPWGVEECVAWHTEFATTNQRPVAWIAGQVTPGTCDSTDQKVWTITSENPGLGPGIGGAGGVVAHLLNGDDGVVEDEVLVPAEEFDGGNLGAYGGAVNAAGDIYFVHMGSVSFGPRLGRIERESLAVTTWPLPPGVASYGITVDHNGLVWISSTLGSGVARFDPDADKADQWDLVEGFASQGGLAEGPNGFMWVATGNGAASVDIETLERGPTFATNMGGAVKGISVDIDGFVWAVNDVAWRVNPETGAAAEFYNGLTSPYTYSDMTGYALGNVTCPPAG